MIRLVPVVVLLIAANAGLVQAQPTPFYSPSVDVELPAGSVVLRLQRETLPSMSKGYPLGARWALVLSGFGDPIALDGRPAPTMPAASGFTDVADARKRLVSRTDRRGNSVTIVYDAQGRVTRIGGPKNTSFTLTLDRGGRVVGIRTSRGDVAYAYVAENLTEVRVNGTLTSRYTYGAAIGPSRVEDPLTGAIDISHDSAGRVSAYRFADGSTMRFEFNAATNQQRMIERDGGVTTLRSGVTTELVDANSQRWLVEWDAARRMRVDTAPDGSVTRTTYDENNRVVATVDAAGGRTERQYDASGRVGTIIHPGDRRQTFEYDAFGSLLAERVNGLLVRNFTYNQDGTVASARGLLWPERRYTYSPEGLVSSITMAMGGTTRFEYDGRGNLVRETNALGGAAAHSYDAQNRLISTIVSTGGEWKYRYDELGRLAEVSDPGQGLRRFEYDSRGRIVASSDGAGRTTVEYDAADRVTRVVRPGNQVETVTYNTQGQVTRESASDATSRTFEYDAVGRLVRERADGAGDVSYRYDAAGALLGITQAGSARTFERDAAGQIARSLTGSAASNFQYDPVSRLLSASDPLGRTRLLTYAPDGSLASSSVGGGDEVLFSYDLEGRRITTRRAGGGVDRVGYDLMGNVTSTAAAGSGEYRLTYDPSGRPTSIITPTAATIKQTFDAADRLIERELGNGARQTFKYDAAGRLVESVDGQHTVRYTYDAAGRVTAVEFPGAQKTVRSAYDDRGRRITLTDGDGRQTHYEYNDAAQVTAMRLSDGSRISMTFDAAGRTRTVSYPNGVVGTYDYDTQGQVTRVGYVNSRGQALVTHEYRFDDAGNVVERRDGAGRLSRFAYDAADQLLEEVVGASTTRLQYAPGGNRRQMVRDGVTTSYEYDAGDRLLNAETVTPPPANRRGAQATRARVTFDYDAAGALKSRNAGTAATAFTFDALDRLTSVRAANGTTTTFAYSADGDRLERTDAKGTTRFVYDGLDLIQEIDANGQGIAAYVFAPGIDRPLAMLKNGQFYFFLADRDGSIIAITDRQGAVVSTYDYDAFGNMRAQKEGVSSPFGFTGREFDQATQLYFHRARYYDPSIGRFLSADAAQPDDLDVLSFNPYIYASNNPLRFTDPLGLSSNPVAPYPSDWKQFADQKLAELGTPRPGFDDLVTGGKRVPSANPALDRLLDQAAEKGRSAPDPIAKYPIRDGKEWEQSPRGPLPPGGPERYRVAPERPRKWPQYSPGSAVTPPVGTPGIANSAITPGRGTLAPSAPAPPPPFAKAPAAAPPAIANAPGRPPFTVTPPGGTTTFTPPGGTAGTPTATAPPPSTPAAPGVRPPFTVTPPTGTPTPTPTGVVPPTVAGGSGTGPSAVPPARPGSPTLQTPAVAGGAPRPGGDTLRTPKPAGTGAGTDPGSRVVPLVLTVLQVYQCYEANLGLVECVERAFLNQVFVIGTMSIVEISLEAAGPAGRAVLAVGRFAAPAVSAGAVTYFTAEQVTGLYEEFRGASAAMEEADAAVAALTTQLQRRIQILEQLRQRASTSLRGRDINARELSEEVAGIRVAVDLLSERISALGASSAACREAQASQRQLQTIEQQLQSQLADLGANVGAMRTRVAACRNAADATAIRVEWSRIAERGDRINAAAARATEVRNQMLDPIRAIQPAQASREAEDVQLRLKLMLERIDKALSATPSATSRTESEGLVQQHATEIAAIRRDYDMARTDVNRRRTWTEWIVEALRSRLLDLNTRLDNLRGAINEEERRMGDLGLGAGATQTDSRNDALWVRLREERARVEALTPIAAASGCPFADDTTLDRIRRQRDDARILLDEADTLLSAGDRCTGSSLPLPPAPRPEPPRDPFVPAARNFSASLDCGDALELEAGGRTELCAVHVSGWDSTTRTPVEVLVRPPFSQASGLSASPGDTSMAGDVMYAAGTQAQPDRYIFSQGWRAAAGAPPSSTVITIFVRQGSNVVRLPLTLNVIGRRAPPGSSLVPPTPVVAGSGGPYCVWQYKLFGDPPPCWHLAAASCTEPRYANRPEYVLVGSNMRRSEADKRVGDLSRYFNDNACRASTTTDYPPFDTDPGVVASTPNNLQAELTCGGQLELAAGSRPESCGVRVRGWRSTTAAPVQVRIEPPISPASGIRVSPGNTAQAGDTMYAAGVSDRAGEYVFSEFWSAERGAIASSNTMVIVVSQGNARVRLPITVNVVPAGTPTGSTFEPPTPNVTGSGGPYCVWQYKLFGDPVGCWHLVAAGCTAPRYANRPEYLMVGNNMTRGEADTRIGQLSRYFDDQACSAGPNPENKDRNPWDNTGNTEPPPPPPDPPAPPREREPPVGPVSRFSRFGIAPRDTTIKVGDAIELRAYATGRGSPDMVMVLDEPEVRWSGDKPRSFTATAADAGRSFRITVTGPAGETDTVTVTVERPVTTDADTSTSTATGTVGGTITPAGESAPVVGAPAPPGALRLLKIDVSKEEVFNVNGRPAGGTKPGPTSFSRRDEDGPNNVQTFSCNFGGVPPNLMPGTEYTITSSAAVSSIPPTWSIYFETRTSATGLTVVGQPVNAYAHNYPASAGRPAPSAGRVVLRAEPNVKTATIGLACYPGGTFVTYTYGVQ